MVNKFSRTELLIGAKAVNKLKGSRVAVFGIGGVGSYVAEALARSGIGSFMLIDSDTVSESNINRQLIATTRTVGMLKTELMRERILEINPDAKVEIRNDFYSAESADTFDFEGYSYIADAIDTVSSKILLIERAKAADVPVISCMGAGNKLDPTRFEVADISKTSVCPLAKVMRSELRKRGVKGVKVVYSTEPALTPAKSEEAGTKRRIPGSVAFVPSVAGLIMAGEIVKDITGLIKYGNTE